MYAQDIEDAISYVICGRAQDIRDRRSDPAGYVDLVDSVCDEITGVLAEGIWLDRGYVKSRMDELV